MSKIGKMPILLKQGVTASVVDNIVEVKGPKGILSYALPKGIKITLEQDKILVKKLDENDKDKNKDALSGLARALIANMAIGVITGFEKKLELSGVGYRAKVSGDNLTLNVGFSHPIEIKANKGISFAVVENTIIITGIDKGQVGNTAATIRAIRPPEPYKGKGIKYKGEKIRRKAGKAAKAIGSTK